MRRNFGIVGCTLLLGACSGSSTFGCVEDVQCGGAGALCATPGYCAFPDEACPSGLSYGAHAAGSFAGECVPTGEATGGDATSTLGTGDGTVGGTIGGTTLTELTTTSPGDATLALDDGTSGVTTMPHDTTTSDAPETDAGSSSGTEPTRQSFMFVADLAMCAFYDVLPPEPALCAMAAGDMSITVDLLEDSTSTGGPTAGYLVFAIDDAFAGGTVLDVRLRMRTSMSASADGNQTGEVWRVEAFTADDLQAGTPAQVGAAPLAADMGAVLEDQEVVWTLPVDSVSPGSNAYLGIFPVATSGVDYLDHTSASPPVLEVDALL